MKPSLTILVEQRKLTRNHSFIRNGLGLNGIRDILSCTEESRRYSDLFQRSKIQYKGSFTKYVKFCLEKKFIRNWAVYGTKGKKKYKPLESWFVITDKGRLFLEMLE